MSKRIAEDLPGRPAPNLLEIGPILEHSTNMKTVLQLNVLTRTEKLRAMEELWKDLSHPEAAYKSPQWHGEILREREASLKAGKDEFVSWEEAKKMLREKK